MRPEEAEEVFGLMREAVFSHRYHIGVVREGAWHWYRRQFCNRFRLLPPATSQQLGFLTLQGYLAIGLIIGSLIGLLQRNYVATFMLAAAASIIMGREKRLLRNIIMRLALTGKEHFESLYEEGVITLMNARTKKVFKYPEFWQLPFEIERLQMQRERDED